VAAVGAYRPEMAELPPQLVRRARLFVDALEGARAEAGDLIQAGVDWARVTPLEDALNVPGDQGKPVVFKSVGHALWDLAAARLAWSKLSTPHQEGATCH
jgi:1-piperideine-2-carboxylate/1-pyrroline-2-carboxylate reductase [NAD(P)H]